MTPERRALRVRRRRLLAAAALASWGGGAATLAAWPRPARAEPAPPPEVDVEIPGARLVGSGRLSFVMLHVYDARLWSRGAVDAASALAVPVALELEYARSLPGRRIAERSLVEMRRGSAIADNDADRWLAWMSATFPDVERGDRITGVHRPGESARFHLNGRLRGELREPEFARRFFAIWLGPQTSEPALRDALLGGAGSR
jgi:hypothetical protein